MSTTIHADNEPTRPVGNARAPHATSDPEPRRLRADDLVSLNRPPTDAERVRRRGGLPDITSRRSVLKGALAIGTGLGLSMLGVFPPIKKAKAECGDWRRITYGCNDLQYQDCRTYAPWNGVVPGCCCSWVCDFYCCKNNGWEHWHRTCGDEHDGFWFENRPNECWGLWTSQDADGWIWWDYECYGCGARGTRCHDGWVWEPGWGWYKSICHQLISCT